MKMTKEKADAIFAEVAKNNNTTIEEVKAEINAGIMEAMKSGNPEVQKKWKDMTKNGTEVTPESLLAYLVEQLK